MDKDTILAAAQRMLDRGMPPEKVREFVQRAKARIQENEKDATDANTLSTGAKVATFADRAVNSAGFGLPSLIGDAVAAGIDPSKSFGDVRAERANRNEQLGSVGILADLAGGLATGATVTKALSQIPRLAKAGTAIRAGLEGAGQGAIQGATDNLTDLSGEGVKNAALGGGAGLVVGGTLGAGLGAGVGGIAGWLKGRSIAKDLVARGVNIKEAQALAKQLPSLDQEAAQAALAKLDEMAARATTPCGRPPTSRAMLTRSPENASGLVTRALCVVVGTTWARPQGSLRSRWTPTRTRFWPTERPRPMRRMVRRGRKARRLTRLHLTRSTSR